jgi:hypothetical protein
LGDGSSYLDRELTLDKVASLNKVCELLSHPEISQFQDVNKKEK